MIVSGLAQGIDSTAHAAAVEADGRTVAVLGEGLLAFDRSGPLARLKLAEAIRRRGAVMSEYAMDHPAKNWTFPRRNATIAALSDVLVVVEAPIGSGALITVDRAVELGRPVYAVPGPVGATTWTGSNRLIADGRARILLEAATIADLLHLEMAPPSVAVPLDGHAQRLLEVLATGPADVDAIAATLGIAPSAVPAVVAEQLLLGTIVPTGDGRFTRR